MSILLGAISVIVAAVVGRFLYRVMFADSDDFWSSVGFLFIPDLVSLARGEYLEDRMKSLKFHAFMIAVIGSGAMTYWALGPLIL